MPSKPPGSLKGTFPSSNPLREEARHLRLKKRFSQNFLVNTSVLQRIAALASPSAGETILEVGPGAGFLTTHLIHPQGKLMAVELDRRMCEYLRRKFADRAGFELVEQDILAFDFASVAAPKFQVVGNLPYQITSKILFLLAGELEQVHYPLRERIRRITVMVQKEVAERITAKPGQRAYNPLSIALQFWYEARLEFIVPATDFAPPPKVESAVITLVPRERPLVDVRDMALFARLVRGAFSQKRKTIRNALLHSSFASGDVLDRIFTATGVNSGLRAEAISIATFGELANAFGSDPGKN